MKLASDRQSGAAEIASRAAQWFGRAVASGVGEDELAEVACTLLLSQTAMAPLYRVANASDLANSETARAIVNLIVSQAELARITAGPPGIPADRLRALRAAYQAALEDPGLLADTKKRGMPIEPLYGEKVREQVVAALNQSPQTRVLIPKVMPMDE